LPPSPVVELKTLFVEVSVIFTDAPGIAAPLASVTLPTIEPKSTWALTDWLLKTVNNRVKATATHQEDRNLPNGTLAAGLKERRSRMECPFSNLTKT
jgi:hypothetical protein